MKKLLIKIKNKFLQKKIDNSITSLSSKIREFKKPIRKVGFIVDSELEIDYLDIVRLTENIGLKEKDLKVVSYSKTVFNDPFYKMRVSDESINFFGNINSADANEFISYDWKTIYSKIKKPAYIFDGRNILNIELIKKIGFNYLGLGRK